LTIEFTRTQQSDNLCNIESSTVDISPRLCSTTFLSTCEIQAGNTKIILKTLNTDWQLSPETTRRHAAQPCSYIYPIYSVVKNRWAIRITA